MTKHDLILHCVAKICATAFACFGLTLIYWLIRLMLWSDCKFLRM